MHAPLTLGGAPLILFCAATALHAATALASEIAAGTVLHLRLQQPASSFGSDADTPVSASVIAPVIVNGRVLVPLGAEVTGRVEAVRRVGLGLSHETSYVQLVFDALELPGGLQTALAARVTALDNARETVDARGRIHGIRATASFAGILSGVAVSLGAADPMLLGFTASSSLSLFRIPESEVILPAGTELRITLTEPLSLDRDYGPLSPPLDTAPLAEMVRALPFRTATEQGHVLSDITNLVFLGSHDAVGRAFDAAGWGQTDPLSPRSTYATLRAIVENQGYREAPVSTLLLDGRAPAFTFAKTLDTFFKRHHARVFGAFGQVHDLDVWTASSTHDSGIGFATRAKSFIHVIDENIDEEREKVAYDLILTGCVDAIGYLDRPWIPRDARNATGDALLTDGRVAILKLNACAAPRRADAVRDPDAMPRERPGAPQRVFRDLTLWLKNDAFRGNIVYQAYAGARLGFRALVGKRRPVSERAIHYGGEEFRIVPGASASDHPLAPDDPSESLPSFQPAGATGPRPPPMLEFSFNAGYSTYSDDDFSTQRLNISVAGNAVPGNPIDAVTTLDPRNGFALKTTFNGHRVSHEVGYTYNRSRFDAVFQSPPVEALSVQAPAQIRQFDYNLLVHFRHRAATVRPYAAIGTGLQVIRISDALEGSRGRLRAPFSAAGFFEGLWDLGSTPPLEGGGIFQPALQYGAGVKVYRSRWVLRADFRETLSAQPDFWTKSQTFQPSSDIGTITFEPGTLTLHGSLRHRLWSAGIGIAF
jgi:LssY-like putative type I secretion system component LssY